MEVMAAVFQGVTSTLGSPVCSFDPEGLIFAAGVESKAVDLYDLRAYDKVEDPFHLNKPSSVF